MFTTVSVSVARIIYKTVFFSKQFSFAMSEVQQKCVVPVLCLQNLQIFVIYLTFLHLIFLFWLHLDFNDRKVPLCNFFVVQ